MGSFRDPEGRLFLQGGRVYRAVQPAAAKELDAFLISDWVSALQRDGRLVDTWPAAPPAAILQAAPDCRYYEHEPVAFRSYPFEWPPEMLAEAAKLTLELATEALEYGYGLKDATPYNVLFRGPNPVFIDVLSFERRDPASSTWLPYAQFIRTMLLPLLMSRHFGAGLDQTLLTRGDGLEPEEILRWLPLGKKLRPPFLQLVTIPSWLGSRPGAADAAIYHPKKESSPEKARFIVDRLLRSLNKMVVSAAPPAAQTSRWTGYMEANNYTGEQFAAKEEFAGDALRSVPAGRLLDVGCNTGHFSSIAAKAGWQVVAVDLDPAVAGALFRRARAERLDILPLVVNLARPTPAVGWFNSECASFLDRASGHFDAVLMLAVIHHMLVTERIPLEEIVRLTGLLTRSVAIVEYIDPSDSMFRRLTRGRDHLHAGLTPERFEAAFQRRFTIERCLASPGGTRRLYLFRKRDGG